MLGLDSVSVTETFAVSVFGAIGICALSIMGIPWWELKFL